MEIQDIEVEIRFVTKKERQVSFGRWILGIKCPACKHCEAVWDTKDRPKVCPHCGAYGACWQETPVRWVIRKTGFWWWQYTARYEAR